MILQDHEKMRDSLPKDKWVRHRATHVAVVGRAKILVGIFSAEDGKIFTDQTKCTIKNADEECWSGDASKKLPEILVAHT